MKIQNNNNLSFNGIKISSAKFEDVREVAFDLARAGFSNLGHKTIYCNNSFSDKMKVARQIRKQSSFSIENLALLFSLGVTKLISWQIHAMNN